MKNIFNYIKKNKETTILLGFGFIIFIIWSLLVNMGYLDNLDNMFYTYIFKIRSDKLTAIFKIITNFAGASFLLATSIILLIFSKSRKIPLFILINTFSAFIVNEIMKNIFMRSRPIGLNLIVENGYSYPSGHSMVALSFYSFITYLLWKKYKSRAIKLLLFIVFIITTLLIGFSRIYLGVHYLSDVIGGFILAIIYLFVFIKIINLEKK